MEQRGTEWNREEQSGTERNRVEQRGTERNRMEQSGTEWNREIQSGTERYRVQQNEEQSEWYYYPSSLEYCKIIKSRVLSSCMVMRLLYSSLDQEIYLVVIHSNCTTEPIISPSVNSIFSTTLFE